MRVFVKRPGKNFEAIETAGEPKQIAKRIIGGKVIREYNIDYDLIVYYERDQNGLIDNVCLGDGFCGTIVAFYHNGNAESRVKRATGVPHRFDYLLENSYPDWRKINDYWE